AGEDFNSHLKLTTKGLTVAQVRRHAKDHHGQQPVASMPMLILDATPVESLVAHVTSLHQRLQDVEVLVTLPGNVTVVQYAGRGNGHTALRSDLGLSAVVREIEQERARFPVAAPEQEGAIAYKNVG